MLSIDKIVPQDIFKRFFGGKLLVIFAVFHLIGEVVIHQCQKVVVSGLLVTLSDGILPIISTPIVGCFIFMTISYLFESLLHRSNKVAGSIFVCYFIITTSLFLR